MYGGESPAASTTPPQHCSGACLYAVLMAFLATLVFVLTFVVILRCCFCKPDGFDSNSTDNAAEVAPPSSGPAWPPNCGLDPDLINGIPVFVYMYMPSIPGEKLECPVCLGEFREGERGRLLPGCRHRFHVECVDEWLRSHATCPLCRRMVVGTEGTTPNIV